METATSYKGNMQTQTAIAQSVRDTGNTSVFHRIWPAALIIFGLGLNAAWVALLGYGLVSAITAAF
jgi:hypothetical protein